MSAWGRCQKGEPFQTIGIQLRCEEYINDKIPLYKQSVLPSKIEQLAQHNCETIKYEPQNVYIMLIICNNVFVQYAVWC